MADQNMLGTFGKAKELRQRILFTLGALIIYRLGRISQFLELTLLY